MFKKVPTPRTQFSGHTQKRRHKSGEKSAHTHSHMQQQKKQPTKLSAGKTQKLLCKDNKTKQKINKQN